MRARRLTSWLLAALAAVALGAALGAVLADRLVDSSLDPATPVSFAWWQFVVMVGGWILQGLQAAGRVTLIILQWSVKALWAFAIAVQHAGIAIGKGLAKFGKASWGFLRMAYREVLKPAWTKFWHFVDRVRATLERIFKPIIKFLVRVQKELLKFYGKWVRPVLDLIGVARRVSRVLASLGLDWARALDRELARIEEAIDRPFCFALAKINEVINVVNRIVDANGLFQRLTLIRSIERDLRYVTRAFANWRSKPLTEADYDELRKSARAVTLEDVTTNIEAVLLRNEGRYRPIAEEAAAQWRIYLSAP
ncbi:MAG: hypothetical protein ACRDH5_00040 [bacterium]